MSKEIFTPGEWEVEEHELSLPERGTVGFRIRTDSQIICAAYSSNLKYKPEMQANAHMIATAPEMYWMLEELKDDLKALSITPNVSEQVKASAWLDIQHIERVQKKARGEE